MNNRKVGSKYEDTVLLYLKNSGFKFVKKNYFTPYGEADLIMKDKSEFVFIEVKARKSLKYGYPAEAVTKTKQLKYLRIAQYFFASENIYDYAVRFDVAQIYIQNDKPFINYIRNAFDFTDIDGFY